MNEPDSRLPDDRKPAPGNLGAGNTGVGNTGVGNTGVGNTAVGDSGSTSGDATQFLQHVAALVVAGVPMKLGISGSSATVAQQVRQVAQQLGDSVPLDLITGLTPQLHEAIENYQRKTPGHVGGVNESRHDGIPPTADVLDSLGKYPSGDNGQPMAGTLAFQALGIVALAALLFVWHCFWVVPKIGNTYRQMSVDAVPWPVAIMEHIGRYAAVYGLLGLIALVLVGYSITRSLRGSGSAKNAAKDAQRSSSTGDVRFRSLMLWQRRQDAVRAGASQMIWSLVCVLGIAGVVTMLYGLAVFGPMTHLLYQLSQDWGTGK